MLGSYYLSQLDQVFINQKSVRYLRYMDDILVFCKTRSALRRTVALCQRVVERLSLKLSYEKTYIGKTSKEFTFLGYCFKGAGKLEVARQTVAKSLARVTSLLEQQALTKKRLERHVQGFVNWAKGGLRGLIEPATARHALITELDYAGVLACLETQTHINHGNRGMLWEKTGWPIRSW